MKAAGLADILSGAGPFTVFAPTIEAFTKVPADTLQSLLKPENKQQLAAILTYSFVSAKVMVADVKPGTVKTVNGADFTITAGGESVMITDGQAKQADVIKTDIAASNGVIHVISPYRSFWQSANRIELGASRRPTRGVDGDSRLARPYPAKAADLARCW